jgi:hypothetical protein
VAAQFDFPPEQAFFAQATAPKLYMRLAGKFRIQADCRWPTG